MNNLRNWGLTNPSYKMNIFNILLFEKGKKE